MTGQYLTSPGNLGRRDTNRNGPTCASSPNAAKRSKLAWTSAVLAVRQHLIGRTFHQLDTLPTRHFTDRTFHWLFISSTWTLLQQDISLTDILPTGHFANWTIHWTYISPTRHFTDCKFHQTVHFTKLDISPTRHFTNWAFYWLVNSSTDQLDISPTWHFTDKTFHLPDISMN